VYDERLELVAAGESVFHLASSSPSTTAAAKAHYESGRVGEEVWSQIYRVEEWSPRLGEVLAQNIAEAKARREGRGGEHEKEGNIEHSLANASLSRSIEVARGFVLGYYGTATVRSETMCLGNTVYCKVVIFDPNHKTEGASELKLQDEDSDEEAEPVHTHGIANEAVLRKALRRNKLRQVPGRSMVHIAAEFTNTLARVSPLPSASAHPPSPTLVEKSEKSVAMEPMASKEVSCISHPSHLKLPSSSKLLMMGLQVPGEDRLAPRHASMISDMRQVGGMSSAVSAQGGQPAQQQQHKQQQRQQPHQVSTRFITDMINSILKMQRQQEGEHEGSEQSSRS